MKFKASYIFLVLYGLLLTGCNKTEEEKRVAQEERWAQEAADLRAKRVAKDASQNTSTREVNSSTTDQRKMGIPMQGIAGLPDETINKIRDVCFGMAEELMPLVGYRGGVTEIEGCAILGSNVNARFKNGDSASFYVSPTRIHVSNINSNTGHCFWIAHGKVLRVEDDRYFCR